MGLRDGIYIYVFLKTSVKRPVTSDRKRVCMCAQAETNGRVEVIRHFINKEHQCKECEHLNMQTRDNVKCENALDN